MVAQALRRLRCGVRHAIEELRPKGRGELYAALAKPLPATIVDEIYTVVRKVKNLDPRSLRAYLVVLRDVQGSFGPAERFVMQRIEGLERLIGAK